MQTKLYDLKDWCKLGTEIEDYPYIGEINGDAKLFEVIKIGNIYYAPCVTNAKNHTAGVRLCNIKAKPIEGISESNIICPYCGFEGRDSWERDLSDDEIECGRCGATIEYSREVTVEYITNGKKPPVIKKREFVKETE